MKKDKDIADNNGLNDKKGKKKWNSAKSGNDSRAASRSPVINQANNSVWLRSSDKEQNKHAIAVAAATAAAADAAVAAAQAAAEVVRLTSQGRKNVYGGGRERLAALKIQSVFRGYLVSKMLLNLKFILLFQSSLIPVVEYKLYDAHNDIKSSFPYSRSCYVYLA